MNKYIKIILQFLALSFGILTYNISLAELSFTVSPIRYEIEASTGTTITKTAYLFNRTNETITIYTGKSDFIAIDNNTKPIFVKDNSQNKTGQDLSNWIEIGTGSFEIKPLEEKEIDFDINIPTNASPGGHYGAVFFKNINSKVGTNSQIKINLEYGVLLLVNVKGEINKELDVKETQISSSGGSGGYGWGGVTIKKDNCPLGDFTNSYYDGKCVNNIRDIIGLNDTQIDISYEDLTDEKQDFSIIFDNEFENIGNTHIKPIGNIKLIDEDGMEIKGIGKEIVLNEDGTIIGEKIVDYLPINDTKDNILPDQNRNFQVEWKGFPYKDYDENGNPIINYWTPGEYYSKKNLDEKKLLLPWEKENIEICEKTITANIETSYTDENGKEVILSSAKDFEINYKQKIISLNPVFFGRLAIIIFILLFLFLIFKKKKKKCEKCSKKIDKNMKICPYCGKKQKNYKEGQKEKKKEKK